MKIGTVTVTGLDKYTDLERASSIWSKYYYLEFGILFGKKNSVEEFNRYPTKDIRTSIYKNLPFPVRKAAHICGEYVKDLIEYDNDLQSELYHFGRVQINVNLDKLDKINFYKLLSEINDHEMSNFRPIIQYNNHNSKYIGLIHRGDILFDFSGGYGTVLDKNNLIQPVDSLGFGYAGGFTPENIYEKLKELDDFILKKDSYINIDVESGVRTDDRLDLNKVELFLSEIERFKNEV